jgi:hypothetical protein
MQRQIFNSNRGLAGHIASRFGAVLAMAGLLLLSACSGSQKDVTQNNLPEPTGMDGVPPTASAVTIRESTKSARPAGTVQPGKMARVDFTASEALRTPVVTINGELAEVYGKVNGWWALREMPDTEPLGEVTFTIEYQDISGEVGEAVAATTDGSSLIFCIDDCPEPVDLAGDWRLDVVGGAGIGPSPGDTQWWNTDIEGVVEIRACWFDDVYRFGPDGSFRNILGDETWLEDWQAGSEQCGPPLAPHDGSTVGTWAYNESTNKLTISGTGLHIGLPRTVNGGDLPGVPVPDSVVYDVVTLENDSMTVAVETAPGNWWTYRLARQPRSPLAGKWRLNKNGGAGIGPSPGDTQWWNTDIEGVVDLRSCWFDDIYDFGDDGSFKNSLGDETWLETWQGVAGETCGAPVAPHDGSNNAIYQYDEDAGTLKLTGVGAHIGLPRTVNGGDLGSPASAPESVTYDVITLDGDDIALAIETGAGNWWTYQLVRISNSPVVGKWKLSTQGGAGVGPGPGDTQWWSTDIEGVVEIRACWFDDIYHFGDDGLFRNYLGDETWLEDWQAGSEQCGAPLAPHDGGSTGSWDYDEAAATLTLNGAGQHIGLPRTVNGGQLPNVPVPDSVVYDVLALDGDSIQVTIDVGDGNWWTYTLARVNDTASFAGKWRLDTNGGAGIGPSPGDTQWWNTDIDGVVDLRACWFDDVVDMGFDGSFRNILGDETWLEPWQIGSETCGAPIAPHDGSARAIFEYDDAAGTLTLHGQGAHFGLPRTVNGGDLTVPAAAPDSVTYDVISLDGDNITLAIETGAGNWWTYKYVRVSNSPWVGNWKLDVNGGAGVGPAPGDTQWWSTDVEGVVEIRACWFDDVFHFGGGGSFQNFMDGETWLEDWQAGAEQCGAPLAPHDGTTAGVWRSDDTANTLTLTGQGLHIGLPRTVNNGQLPNVPVPDSVTYDVLSFDLGSTTLTIDVGDGNWWTYKLARE